MMPRPPAWNSLPRTETEALLLEANLIKRLRPRFNVLIRDDKSFPYILITRDHPSPEIFKHRGARTRKGDIRPVRLGRRGRGAPSTRCSAHFCCAPARMPVRKPGQALPAVPDQALSAPCTGEISLEDYGVLVDEALAFLTGESDEVKRRLQALMDEASLRQDYRAGGKLPRPADRARHIQSRQGINPHTVKEADVFAAHQEAGQTCIQVFFFRTGNNWGNRAYFPRADKSVAVERCSNPSSPSSTTTSCRRNWCCCRTTSGAPSCSARPCRCAAAHKIGVMRPVRGEKRELVEHALVNAREALARRLAESSSQAAILRGSPSCSISTRARAHRGL